MDCVLVRPNFLSQYTFKNRKFRFNVYNIHMNILITIHESNVMPHNSNDLECRNTFDCALSGNSDTRPRCNPHGFCEGNLIKM